MSVQDDREAELFNAARKLMDPDRRSAYVIEHARGDGLLVARVNELLDANDEAAGFLSVPGPSPSSAEELDLERLVGQSIGQYKLTRPLGKGGMGVVFLAEQRDPMCRTVALKLIRPGMGSADFSHRFAVERQALALMNHPYIARALDAGTTLAGQPYFVMEYVEGTPITEFCDQRKMTIEERLRIFQLTCEAVMHAHQKGVIHRDLKPTNILVSGDNGRAVPKIIDFGIAKALGEQVAAHGVTTVGQLLGTLEYMSPEQVRRDHSGVDTRSDVYGLGVLLYQLLTGNTPFESSRLRQVSIAEAQRIICEEEPPRPSQVLIGVKTAKSLAPDHGMPQPLRQRPSLELDWIVMKAIEKEPSRRYNTVSDLAADIDRFLSHEPVSAGPPSTLYRLGKAVRRHHKSLAAAILIAAAMFAGTAVAAWNAVKATRALQFAAQESARAKSSEEKLRHTLYASDMRMATLAWQRNDVRRMTDLLARNIPGSGQKDFRGFEWWFLMQHTAAHPEATFRVQVPLYTARLSPSTDRIAIAGAAGTIWLLDSNSLQEKMELDTAHIEVNGLDFAPDGTTLLSCGDDGTVCHWDVSTGHRLAMIRAHKRAAYNVLFGPEANTCISSGRDNNIRIWNVTSGLPIHELRRHSDDIQSMVLTPHGLLIAGSDDRTVSLWDPEHRQQLSEFTDVPASRVQAVACSKHDALVATGHNDGLLTIRRTDSNALIAQQDLREVIHSVAFSPGSDKDESTIVAVGDRAGCVHLLPSGYSTAPSGLIASDDSVQRGRHWVAHRGRVYALAFTPDGRRLFTAGEDGLLNMWNIHTHPQVRKLAKQVNEFVEIGVNTFLCVGRSVPEAFADGGDSVVTLREPHTARRVRYATSARRAFNVAWDERSIWVSDVEGGDPECVVSVDSKKLIGKLAVTPDAELLAYETYPASRTGKGSLHIRKRRGEQVIPLDRGAGDILLTRDGHLLVSEQQDVGVFDVASAVRRHSIARSREGITCLTLSPDELHLATAHGDKSLHVWNWKTGEELWSEVANTGPVQLVAFSPDGETLATTGKDAVLRLWRWKLGLLVFEYPIDSSSVSQLAFSHDGGRILLLTDGVVASYEAKPTAPLTSAIQ